MVRKKKSDTPEALANRMMQDEYQAQFVELVGSLRRYLNPGREFFVKITSEGSALIYSFHESRPLFTARIDPIPGA